MTLSFSSAIAAILTGIFMTTNVTLAQGTAFSYQGRLMDTGSPANGDYDISFTIFDAASGGNQVGTSLTNAPTTVSNGLFTVTLDFGTGIFSGAQRWLQIGVHAHGSNLPDAILSPRQEITAAPYAIAAGSATTATTATTATSISGTISGSSIAGGTVTSTQLAGGAAVANLSASGQSGVASGGIVLSAPALLPRVTTTAPCGRGQK